MSTDFWPLFPSVFFRSATPLSKCLDHPHLKSICLSVELYVNPTETALCAIWPLSCLCVGATVMSLLLLLQLCFLLAA